MALSRPDSPDFVRQQLEDKSAEQDLLFHHIPQWENTQSESFAVRHDTKWRCMMAVLGVEGVLETAQEVLQWRVESDVRGEVARGSAST